ncbi:hypothetical protein [Nocardia otitidiscaviarum]|uniref:hypothetical protein n=1 Tax=Nocardia otitidiscaviarum TaxID=1823 RepID=UPI0004A71F17|nr:hypothetical protein [Nocardia otitidiscaviarum]
MTRLACYVYLTDETGEVRAFGPDSAVPEWARKKITNPHVWQSQEAATPATGEVEPEDGPPPQGGPGASRQRWADYASPLLAAKGVEVQADWKREDIIAACEKAGVPV